MLRRSACWSRHIGAIRSHSGVQSAYGRLALAMGHDELAARLLESAVASDPGDWRALSAQGVLEWRGGRPSEARGALVKAKSLSAEDSAVLNNLAVSYLLENRAAEAASLLRQALASPSLNPVHAGRIRRNLAVALAVEGNFAEADRLAQAKLPRSLQTCRGKRNSAFHEHQRCAGKSAGGLGSSVRRCWPGLAGGAIKLLSRSFKT